jgi:glutathione S-transferase
MKLYYNPQSRAAIAKWMLDECGADYEIVPIDFTKREHKTPEFLKINPAGKLPALVDGDAKIFEGAKSSRKPNLLPRSARRNGAAISR